MWYRSHALLNTSRATIVMANRQNLLDVLFIPYLRLVSIQARARTTYFARVGATNFVLTAEIPPSRGGSLLLRVAANDCVRPEQAR